MGGRNGFFQILIKGDGTYLKLHAAEGGGISVFFEEIGNYLIDQKIYEFDKAALQRALANLNGVAEVKLSNFIVSAINEYLRVEIMDDRMFAKASFYPPSNNGQLLTKEDIIGALVRAGVKYGLDEEAIAQFMKNRCYCTEYILAKATPAIQGHDAKITYHFNIDLTLKPKTNEDGSVDFHQLDMISHCHKGQLLATLEPMDPGKPGIDVYGVIIRPNKVVNRILRHGNKVHLSEDGLQMFSDVDGHVSLVDNRVFVSDTYEVPADVNASTGDIVYDGNVIIRGNVITGFSVRARGDIEVNGVVEGAYLEAGGQIILKRGMQGMNKGILRAGGNVITKFLENAEVIAGGYISTESILHSKASAKGDVIVGGKRGFVTGGEIHSGTLISVKTAGSQMGTATLMEVGIDPRILEEFRELDKKIAVLLADKDRLAQAILLFRKKLSTGTPMTAERMDNLKQLTQNNILLETQIKEARKRHDELRVEVENTTSGAIKVSDVVYPGTKLMISNVIYFVREEIHHSKFIRDKADIKVVPLF